ncbi:MAG: peptidylprolyl isomerase [Bacteroidota bacterium]|nr:peptidylprolyl isomerase [Odoribacter sp.]MDP3642761.1 peptidylprolyl isomerase [Bacteroidota bacterium]
MKMNKLALLFVCICLFVNQSSGVSKKKREAKFQIVTEFGTVKIKLYNETPLHRDNFIKLTKEGFYSDLLFHRVIPKFMIQGGDPDSKNAEPGKQLGSGDLGYTIPAEINPKFFHRRGVLAAARMGDQVNPEKRSSASQFYILQGRVFRPGELDSLQTKLQLSRIITFSDEQRKAYTTVGGYPSLDNNYTIFGEVIEGMEVVDKIAQQPTDPRNRPLKDVRFTISKIKK